MFLNFIKEEKMKEPNKIRTCLWKCRYELIGLVLLVIATLLTIFTVNSVGIAAMFLVALVLCKGCYCGFYCKHYDSCENSDDGEQEKKPRGRKPTNRKAPVKKT